MRRNKANLLFGMTRFEFIIAACILLLAIYYFLNKTYQVWVVTERITFQQVINTLRSSLYYAMIKSREGSIKLPEHCVNPMDFVSTPPLNYLGVIEAPSRSSELDGHWYFDRQQCQLNYQWRFIRLADYFKQAPTITGFTVEITPTPGNTVFKKNFIIKEVTHSNYH